MCGIHSILAFLQPARANPNRVGKFAKYLHWFKIDEIDLFDGLKVVDPEKLEEKAT